MKKLAVLLIAVASLMSGCVVYDGPNRGHPGDRDGPPGRVDRDRDHDGVRDNQDRRPNNPNRY
ncbi:MAG: hypothetical protein Q8S26_12330 [Azonexus sp.]|nr:hypothetical protein [Azonexus sp.]